MRKWCIRIGRSIFDVLEVWGAWKTEWRVGGLMGKIANDSVIYYDSTEIRSSIYSQYAYT